MKEEQRLIQRLIALGLILIWIEQWRSGGLLHQLVGSPIRFVAADNTYWLFYATGFPQALISSKYLCLSWDFSWLVGATLYFVGYPKKLIGQIICVGFIVHYICSTSASGIHNHTLVPALFCSLLLCVKSERLFVYLFVGLRYYICFVMFDAFLWKLRQGGLFNEGQMLAVLKEQHLESFASLRADKENIRISFLLKNPIFAQFLWYGGSFLEATFIIGFFTRRWDRVLAFNWCLFIVADYFVMNLIFLNFIIALPVFYPWLKLWKEYRGYQSV